MNWNDFCKLPVVNERLNKLADRSEIFLTSFDTLVVILNRPVALLIPRDKRISLISSLSVGERKKELEFSFVR